MTNFERHILRAIPKIKKEYLKEWNEKVHKDIYLELDSIKIYYEDDDSSWADVSIRWGRDSEDKDQFSFYNDITIAIYPERLKYIVGFILGVIRAKEEEAVK